MDDSKTKTTRRSLLTTGSLGIAAAATAGLGAASAADAAAPSTGACGGMTRERYMEYVTLFNANDPRFIEWYHPDVELELSGQTIKGDKAIRDFYKEVKAHIREKVEITHFVSDATGIAGVMPTEFRVYKDWPKPNFFNRDLKAGEVMRTITFGLYWVEDGKFRQIRAARYRQVNDWRMEG
ncbi:MAG: nuclear transport factor 2 family protein [Sphingomonadales bacterium]|nr:MAG: nuclear transport factor 2 family protein [Sphingomonadales bacterium]